MNHETRVIVIALIVVVAGALLAIVAPEIRSYSVAPKTITTNLTFIDSGSHAVIYTMNITFSNYSFTSMAYLNFTINKAFETFPNGTTIQISNTFATKYFETMCLNNPEGHEITFFQNKNEHEYICS